MTTDTEILDALDYPVCACGTEAVYAFDAACPNCATTYRGYMCREHAMTAMRATWICARCETIHSFERVVNARTQIGELT